VRNGNAKNVFAVNHTTFIIHMNYELRDKYVEH